MRPMLVVMARIAARSTLEKMKDPLARILTKERVGFERLPATAFRITEVRKLHR
jgi:hypothetical protein